MAAFYDTHAHLDSPVLAREMPEVIQRAQEAGISRIITIATDIESSLRAIQLAEQFQPVYAAVGCHPTHVLSAADDIRPDLRRLARHPKVVALGETGLDYYRLPSKQTGGTQALDDDYKARQSAIFEQHLEIARETGLPCVIHQRDSMEDTIRILAPFAPVVRAVFHCFVDGPDVQRRVQEMGALVSFTGIVTYKNAGVLRETVQQVGLDQFMLETDSPYLAPTPFRGKRCEPAHVALTARSVAETRGCSLEELSRATCATADRFFFSRQSLA